MKYYVSIEKDLFNIIIHIKTVVAVVTTWPGRVAIMETTYIGDGKMVSIQAARERVTGTKPSRRRIYGPIVRSVEIAEKMIIKSLGVGHQVMEDDSPMIGVSNNDGVWRIVERS